MSFSNICTDRTWQISALGLSLSANISASFCLKEFLPAMIFSKIHRQQWPHSCELNPFAGNGELGAQWWEFWGRVLRHGSLPEDVGASTWRQLWPTGECFLSNLANKDLKQMMKKRQVLQKWSCAVGRKPYLAEWLGWWDLRSFWCNDLTYAVK